MRESKNDSDILNFINSTPKKKDGKMNRIRGNMSDTTEEMRFQAQIQQAQKMDAISTLAGGIAHLFNNALVGIIGNIELLKMDLPDNKKVDKYVEPMEACVHRMVHLTNQLVAYASGGKYHPKAVCLSHLVKYTLPTIEKIVDSAIRVETDLKSDISYVEADLVQMQMVVSAVVVNAAEAIEGPGRIMIMTRDEEIDEELAERQPGLKPGRFVCLLVEDDGKGMNEETKSRVFEPFFTTKFQGRGLGMAAVYGVVKNHDGWVSVDSELGKGTIVRIYLPASDVQIESEALKTELTKEMESMVAMEEDQEIIMEMSQAML